MGRLGSPFNALLQTACVVCQHVGQGVLCEDCRSNIEKPKHDCAICGQTITGESVAPRCGQCLINPPPYESLHYIGHYNKVLSTLIIKAKVGKQIAAVVALQSLIDDFAQQHPTWGKTFADYHLLAMPTPRSRLMQRGFNLPLLLAKCLSKQFDLPVMSQKVVTLPFFVRKQARLNRKQRQKNPHLYQINHKSTDKLSQKIMIVDDIVTTGTTIAELGKKLRGENIKNLAVWAVARVNNDD